MSGPRERESSSGASSKPCQGKAWQAAIDFGIDMSQIEVLRTLTPTERLNRHAQALAVVRAMRAAGEGYYGFDPRHPEAAQ
ncbi:MAG: hypothetical protein ABII12_15730 [Planctomycetota bacterium]